MKSSLLDRAIHNFENENFRKAIKQFEKILKSDPENLEAVINKSSCLAEIGKYDDAIEQLEIFLKTLTFSLNFFILIAFYGS